MVKFIKTESVNVFFFLIIYLSQFDKTTLAACGVDREDILKRKFQEEIP